MKPIYLVTTSLFFVPSHDVHSGRRKWRVLVWNRRLGCGLEREQPRNRDENAGTTERMSSDAYVARKRMTLRKAAIRKTKRNRSDFDGESGKDRRDEVSVVKPRAMTSLRNGNGPKRKKNASREGTKTGETKICRDIDALTNHNEGWWVSWLGLVCVKRKVQGCVLGKKCVQRHQREECI